MLGVEEGLETCFFFLALNYFQVWSAICITAVFWISAFAYFSADHIYNSFLFSIFRLAYERTEILSAVADNSL